MVDIYLREDICNALLAAEAAARGVPGVGDEMRRAYLAGFRAALATIALAFGLRPSLFVLEDEARDALEMVSGFVSNETEGENEETEGETWTTGEG